MLAACHVRVNSLKLQSTLEKTHRCSIGRTYVISWRSRGALSGAARSLKVDATVSRRLAALEAEAASAPGRTPARSCRLTPLGLRLHEQARPWKHRRLPWALARASQEPMAGKVTLSAPPVLVTHLLARRLADFRRAHPAIQLSVSAQAQQVSLNRREADVALRLVRPRVQLPGSQAWPDAFRALCQLGLRGAAADNWTFIAYDAQFSDMPQQLAAGHRRPAGHQLRVERYQQPPGGGARRSRRGRPALLSWRSLPRAAAAGTRRARVLARHLAGGASRPAPFRARAGRHGLCRRYRRGAIRLQPWTLLARHWQRAAEPPRPGAGRVGPRPAGWPPAPVQSRPVQALPTHLTNTPMSQSVPIGCDVPRGHIASVVTDLEMLSKPATAELPCLKASR